MAILVVAIVSPRASFSFSIPLTVFDALDTAFVASRGGWMYCDDSSVKHVDPKQVVVSFFAADAIPHDADSISIK